MQEIQATVSVARMENIAAKEKQLAAFQEEKIKLYREIQGLEEQGEEAIKEMETLRKDMTETRETMEMTQEAHIEECEALKTKLTHKDNQLKSAKQDILQLSKIVTDMSALNSELNTKILGQNGSIEKLNASDYEARVKVTHIDELESAYNELRGNYLKSDERNKSLIEENARLRGLEDVSRTMQIKLKSIEDALNATSDIKKATESLQELRFDLKKNTALAPPDTADLQTLKQEIRELKNTLNERSLELEKARKIEEVRTARITFLEGEKGVIKVQWEEAVDRLQRRNKVTQDWFEKLRAKIVILEEQLLDSESNLHKSSMKLKSLQNQLDELKTTKKEMEAAESKWKTLIRDLKSQVLAVKTQLSTQESSISKRERSLRLTATKMKVQTDEIWKRDTEIMKLKKSLSTAEEEAKNAKLREKEAYASEKTRNAESLGKLGEDMEQKEQEITILRGMLKSTQQQVKNREAEVNRLKKKYENDPIREVPRDFQASSELNPMRLALKLDSELKKIEDLASLRSQVESSRSLPSALLQKSLKTDQIPSGKAKVMDLLTTKMRETAEVLEKWAGFKLKTGVQKDSFAGRSASGIMTDLLKDRDTVEVGEVMGRVQEIITG